jgi:hypothetical protein
MGSRGIGEIGIVGAAAAIANGTYHATGTRVRDLPVTADQLTLTLSRDDASCANEGAAPQLAWPASLHPCQLAGVPRAGP